MTELRYSTAFYYALAFHVLLLIILMLNFTFSTNKNPVVQNSDNIIQASVVQSTSLKKVERTQTSPKQEVQPQLEKPVQEKITQDLFNQEKVAAQEQRKNEQLISQQKQKKVQEEKRRTAQLAKQQEKKLEQKMLQDALAAEHKALLAKQVKEAKRKASELKKQTQLAANQHIEQQLAAEQSELTSAQTSQMQGEVDKYKAMILKAIGQQWIIPDTSNKDLSCKLHIRLTPTGMVLNVKLLSSSGDDALDRSAIAAVYKSSPLPVPTDSGAFEQFREFNLTVHPE